MENLLNRIPLVRKRGDKRNSSGALRLYASAEALGHLKLAVEGVKPGTDDEKRTHKAPNIGDIAPDEEAQEHAPYRRGVAERGNDRDRAGAKRTDVKEIGGGDEDARAREIEGVTGAKAVPVLQRRARHRNKAADEQREERNRHRGNAADDARGDEIAHRPGQ